MLFRILYFCVVREALKDDRAHFLVSAQEPHAR